MKFLQFDWPTGNEISSLVGRWASPNIPHASCTHCTQGVHSEVELRKCCLGQSEKKEIPYYLITILADLQL